MGMRCPGTGSPFPRWALRWGVMTNAVPLVDNILYVDSTYHKGINRQFSAVFIWAEWKKPA